MPITCHPTINGQWHRLAQPPCNDILCPAGVVARIAESGHADNEAALTGDNEVYVPFIIDLLPILLPKYLEIDKIIFLVWFGFEFMSQSTCWDRKIKLKLQ